MSRVFSRSSLRQAPTANEAGLLQSKGTSLCVTLILSAFPVYFLFRGAGLEAIVFADEWLHSTSARLTRIADAYSPSFAFYALYRITNSCGYAFLDCARTLNILLFLGSAILFYRFSLRYVDTQYALLLLVICLGAPSNILLLLLLTLESTPGAIIGGALLGVMAVVKMNATLLLPGPHPFVLIEGLFEQKSWRRSFLLSALAVAAFLGSRTVLAICIAGERGLSFTGTHYSGYLPRALEAISRNSMEPHSKSMS